MSDRAPRVSLAETFIRKRGVNVFQCSVCGREFRHDDEYEPMCTGPSWTDDHPPTVMKFVGTSGLQPRIIVPFSREKEK